ncbi:MAG: redoxin, partial [Acidobacteria bacterium]|nr:redoxin [Acidobacteriota bacterium]
MKPAALLFLSASAVLAQRNQVQWTLAFDPPAAPPGARTLGRLTATIEPGWHLYSLTPAAKPANIPTTIKIALSPAVEAARVFQPQPKRAFDKNFNTDTETYDNQAIFLIELALSPAAPPGPAEIASEVRYQVCDATRCIPPVRRTAAATLMVDPKAPAPSLAIPAGYSEPSAPAAPSPVPAAATGPPPAQVGGLAFLLVAFGFGLAAVFTPCVFPMIPVTLSFFLKRSSGARGEAVFQAAVFCLGIIVLFSGLGALATAILGPFGLVQLGSNLWVNGFVALVFLIFGLSLLGAFEITIPSSLLTRLDRGSERPGVAGTLLMGLTFSLTSFACVGPFMGPLLAASVEGGSLRPLAGMAAFSSGLALPFFLLALFPSLAGRLPRSGGWLARVKVVMGFVILAAMLKYWSAVDQVLQWNFLTRERFLA